MKLQDYIKMNTRFTRMNELVDLWDVDYSLERLKPLIDHGFEYEDISEFLLVRFHHFVHGGKLDELLERDKQRGEK